MEPLDAWAHAQAGAHPWAWLFTGLYIALTFWLGLRVQWREIERLLGTGGIRENTRMSEREMADENPLTPRQDPDDGLWYVPTFDPQTGRRSGKRAVEPPNLRAPTIGRSVKLGMFNR